MTQWLQDDPQNMQAIAGKPVDEEAAQARLLNGLASALSGAQVLRELAPSRALSLAITKLEEAEMWLEKAGVIAL